MMYEKTQKGNPHNLTKKQHIFPKFLIKNFCDEGGYVEFFHFSDGIIKKVTPKDMVFCTKRVWDERAESGYMKSIEEAFLGISNQIILNNKNTFSKQEHMAISEMHLLWLFRQQYRDRYPEDIKLNGVMEPKDAWTKDEQEQLEAKHVIAFNDKGNIPARNMIGDQIQQLIMRHKSDFEGKKWGLLRAKKCEFLVPDKPKFNVFPIHPKICFIEGEKNKFISKKDVMTVNQYSVHNLENYYFGKNLNDCRII